MEYGLFRDTDTTYVIPQNLACLFANSEA